MARTAVPRWFLAVGTGALVLSCTSAAMAAPVTCGPGATASQCTIGAGDSTPAPSPAPSKSGQQTCKDKLGHLVACKSADGSFSNRRGCYLQRLDPQPPKSDPVWQGHMDGAVYQCTWPASALPSGLVTSTVWLPSSPTVDPEALAQQALDRMQFKAIKIGTHREMQYVAIPVQLWVRDPTPRTVGPLKKSVSAGGVTVTVRAKLKNISWAAGGAPCRTYQRPEGLRARPLGSCQFMTSSARQPHNAYRVRATSNWVIDWTSNTGASGTLTRSLTAQTQVAVGEIQVLVE